MSDILKEITHLIPLEIDTLERLSSTELNALDALTTRFGNLQTTCGEHIFPLLLTCLKEDVTQKPFIDILNLCEKLRFIKDANIWDDFRKARNAIAHEYPENPTQLVKDINNVYTQAKVLLEYWETLKAKINTTVFA